MSNEDKRKIRIDTLLALIKKCNKAGKSANYNKMIAVFSMEWGLSRRIVQEYLKTLKDANKITMEGTDMWAKNVEN